MAVMGKKDKKGRAFHELDAVRSEAKKYLPDDFDPDKELEEARTDRFSVVDFGRWEEWI